MLNTENYYFDPSVFSLTNLKTTQKLVPSPPTHTCRFSYR